MNLTNAQIKAAREVNFYLDIYSVEDLREALMDGEWLAHEEIDEEVAEEMMGFLKDYEQ